MHTRQSDDTNIISLDFCFLSIYQILYGTAQGKIIYGNTAGEGASLNVVNWAISLIVCTVEVYLAGYFK